MTFCYTHKYTQPSSEKLLLAEDQNKHRDPQWINMQRVRAIEALSAKWDGFIKAYPSQFISTFLTWMNCSSQILNKKVTYVWLHSHSHHPSKLGEGQSFWRQTRMDISLHVLLTFCGYPYIYAFISHKHSVLLSILKVPDMWIDIQFNFLVPISAFIAGQNENIRKKHKCKRKWV